MSRVTNLLLRRLAIKAYRGRTLVLVRLTVSGIRRMTTQNRNNDGKQKTKWQLSHQADLLMLCYQDDNNRKGLRQSTCEKRLFPVSFLHSLKCGFWKRMGENKKRAALFATIFHFFVWRRCMILVLNLRASKCYYRCSYGHFGPV